MGPVVSISCLAYNHAPFIRRCLDGFLAQDANFTYEVIVHDDCSLDGTADIIREYQASHPEVMRSILQTENQKGLGKWPTWDFNAPKWRGKYVALCEGDDYWIDSRKLQLQIDALEADPAASGCFTNAFNEKDGVRQVFLGEYNKVPESLVLEQAEYLRGQGIPTCTFVFRREWTEGFAEAVRRFATGDTALFTMLLEKGHFIYLPLFTGVRVVHPGGDYSMKGPVHHLRVQLHNLREQDKLTGGRHHAIIQHRRKFALTQAWQEALRSGNWALARLAWKQIFRQRSLAGWSRMKTWRNGVLAHFPKSYYTVRHVLDRLLG